jgi:predicted nuclease of predicted toxin-antitoxin system
LEFVADESCARPVIRALRSAVHDVLAIAEMAKGMSDEHVLQLAFDAERVLVTEDTDFGRLVYARGRPSTGVILVKFHSRARRAKSAAVAEAVSRLGDQLRGGLATI